MKKSFALFIASAFVTTSVSVTPLSAESVSVTVTKAKEQWQPLFDKVLHSLKVK